MAWLLDLCVKRAELIILAIWDVCPSVPENLGMKPFCMLYVNVLNKEMVDRISEAGSEGLQKNW